MNQGPTSLPLSSGSSPSANSGLPSPREEDVLEGRSSEVGLRAKVAIAGFGSEGLSAYNYFAKTGADITIFDQKAQPNQPVPSGAKFVHGPDYLDNLNDFDIVVRFPGLRPDAIKTNARITSVIKEFFNVCPAPIIGVTASKGKGTISSLTAAMLQACGIKTQLGGNIGVPALELLPQVQKDSVVVLELSSFQLWDLTKSPHVAIVGMIEPDHLDVHKDFDEYVAAKTNIAQWQQDGDVMVYHPTNEFSARIANMSKGTKIRYASPEGAHIQNGHIVIDGQTICGVNDVQIPGQHNLDNICAAITAVWQLTQDREGIARATREFKGLEHRLEFVRELDGVKYYDDTFATAPTSAAVAAQAFGQAKIMILGGHDKRVDLQPMAEMIAKTDIKKLLLIGQTGPMLAKHFKALGLGEKIEELGSPSMTSIVARAHEIAKPGDVVLLSPGCASFDMFKNYKDRGDQFQQAVNAL
jgi:UDP-N-acetylmuramoylalanine--D-glutamate ligase